jgi:hypothetical protein
LAKEGLDPLDRTLDRIPDDALDEALMKHRLAQVTHMVKEEICAQVSRIGSARCAAKSGNGRPDAVTQKKVCTPSDPHGQRRNLYPCLTLSEVGSTRYSTKSGDGRPEAYRFSLGYRWFQGRGTLGSALASGS